MTWQDDDDDCCCDKAGTGLDPERQLLRKRRVITLLDSIDQAAAKRVCEDLRILESQNHDPIELVISTNGGGVLSMFAIMDMIAYVQKRGILVTGRVIGRAMSAGFNILQKCDRRVMSPHSYLMAHGAWGFSIGDIKDKQATLNWEKDIRDRMAHLVAERNTGADSKYHNPEFWRDLFTEDTPVFLSVDQAIEWGVVDEVER
jgi:ATP-dependent protease ClpP protease subunit